MAYSTPYRFSADGVIGFGEVSTGETFTFDAEDFERIRDTTWYRCNSGNYIGDRSGYCIHRRIMNAPVGYEVDHINHDPLDNRKSNLRICTHRENQYNQPLQRNNTSGASGVSYYPPRRKYRARIKYDQQEIHLGYFTSFLEGCNIPKIVYQFFFSKGLKCQIFKRFITTIIPLYCCFKSDCYISFYHISFFFPSPFYRRGWLVTLLSIHQNLQIHNSVLQYLL